jgi:hypothetical protein
MGARVDIASIGRGPAARTGSSTTGSSGSQPGGKGGASEPGSHSTQRLNPSLNHSVRPDRERLQRTPLWTASLVAAPGALT